MTSFYSNYVSLCAKNKKSLSAVAESVGLSRTAPNGWKKGKKPSEVTLEKLSQYFGVSVSELTEEQEEKPASDGSELDADTKELLDIWNNEDDAGKKALIEMARFLKSKRNK